MKNILFILNTKSKIFLMGVCSDLTKAVAVFDLMPVISIDENQKLMKLVYSKKFETEQEASDQLKIFQTKTRKDLIIIIKNQNEQN